MMELGVGLKFLVIILAMVQAIKIIQIIKNHKNVFGFSSCI